MPPAPPPEEIAQLMRFIAEQSKGVKSPMNLQQLCRLFKEEFGSHTSESYLTARILSNRERIYKIREFDMDTKVEMMFALSSPITADFLIELKKHAEVEVDDAQRIIRFKKTGGGLELHGRHEMPFTTLSDEITLLMRFLAKKSKNVKSPLSIAKLCRQFKEETGSVVSERCLRTRIYSNRDRIHKMNEFDVDTKVEMMLSAPIVSDFLIELRKHAEVEVDDSQRIIRFKKMGGALELSGRHHVPSMQIIGRSREMLQLLVEKAETVMTPIDDISFVVEFQAMRGDRKSLPALLKMYERLKRTIFELPGIDKHTRIKMMFISGSKLPERALEELRTDAYVEVDIHGRMRKYEAIDGSLELEGDHSFSTMMNAAEMDITRQSLEAISRGTKRAREELLQVENNFAMDFDNAEDFDYDPLYYEKDNDHIPVEKKPKSLVEVKREVPEEPSTSIGGEHFFFDYDPPNYEKNLEHTPEEKKPESLIKEKAETPEEPSMSNPEYHYEEHLEHVSIEPKLEIN